MFLQCCDNPKMMKYTIKHKPKPLNLTKELIEAIERLLWYVPEINSIQSSSNELIKEKIYDDFCFEYILARVGMEQTDVVFENNKADLSVYYDYFKGQICLNCQKLILKKNQSETKTMCMLRHIRNSIAHGRFNLCDDMMIGFDYSSQCTAIIKIKPKTLLNALELLECGITYQYLFEYAFGKLGYTVQYESRSSVPVDLVVEKDDKKYLIEIKIQKSGYIREEMVNLFIHQYEAVLTYLDRNSKLVLMIDKARLTNKSKKYLENQRISILDINRIKELLQGKDVLSEL